MKKRNKSHKPIQTSVPMIINRLVHQNVETLEENITILAFRRGFATKEHYDNLVKIANMMNIAAQIKPSLEAGYLLASLNAVAKNIYERYQKLGRFGLSGTEFIVLKKAIETYDLYWKKQTTTLYNNCVAELNAFYADVENRRIAA